LFPWSARSGLTIQIGPATATPGKTRVPGGGNGEHDQPVERQAESKRTGQNAAPFENSTDPKDEAAARRATRNENISLERIFKETRSWNRPQKFGVNNVYAELDTAALFGEITIKNGRVEQGNFDDYRMLRINEAPLIDVHLVKSTEAPGGVGEPGTSAVMPAVANAIFAATGKRVRKLPINSAQLKSI
jgi:hypothetical protein